MIILNKPASKKYSKYIFAVLCILAVGLFMITGCADDYDDYDYEYDDDYDYDADHGYAGYHGYGPSRR